MKETNYFRIGFMGSSCSGKTTTAIIIANDLKLELEEEIESKLLANWIASGKIKDKRGLYPDLSREFQEQALSIREYNSEQIVRGVSDRTAADLLVYNRIYVQPYFSGDYAAKFTKRCETVMKTYSHLFMFPVGVLPLEDNGSRTMNIDYQKKIHNLLLQVLNELMLPYIFLSQEKLTVNERVEEVKKCLIK